MHFYTKTEALRYAREFFNLRCSYTITGDDKSGYDVTKRDVTDWTFLGTNLLALALMLVLFCMFWMIGGLP